MDDQAGSQRCYRHPDREAYIACQRCERPICPDDMRDASVGFHCPDCVQQGARNVRRPRTVAGGAIQTREGIVSLTLIGINVVAFVLTDVLRLDQVTAAGAMIAANVQTADGTVFLGVADGGYWRLLTAAFLHAGIFHLGLNMVTLYLFGPFVERSLGTWRFLGAYLATALVSSAFVYVLSDPRSSTVGASGAIYGLFGMTLLLSLKARQDVRGLLVLIALLSFFSLRDPQISWEGHLGGLVAGVVLGAVFAYAPRSHRTVLQVLTFVALGAAVVVAVLARTAYLTG